MLTAAVGGDRVSAGAGVPAACRRHRVALGDTAGAETQAKDLPARTTRAGPPAKRSGAAVSPAVAGGAYRNAGSGRPISSVKPAPSRGTNFCVRPRTLSTP